MAVIAVIAIGVLLGISGVFKGGVPQVVPASEAAQNLEVVKQAHVAAAGRMNILSKCLFVAIFVIQLGALTVGASVVSGIKEGKADPELKLKKLENADIFMDLPLYVGLFGTVSSFIIMSFNPETSRLIAYSSTLVGIIISLVLRLSLIYPLRQKLLVEAQNDDK